MAVLLFDCFNNEVSNVEDKVYQWQEYKHNQDTIKSSRKWTVNTLNIVVVQYDYIDARQKTEHYHVKDIVPKLFVRLKYSQQQ